LKLSFVLNGTQMNIEADPNIRLIDLLRDEFGLTGTKEGCGQGECGACTIIINNAAVHSCLVLASQIDGCEILTIEGLGNEEGLDPVQTAFISEGAIQCGYCTPGMIMSVKALLMNNPCPSDSEIKEAISGNICRCTGYHKIIEATKVATDLISEGR